MLGCDMTMKSLIATWMRALAAVLALAAFAAPASAQFSDSYNFLKAVRDKDVNKARELLDKPGTVVVNTRDQSTGESALHIATRRSDTPWMGFLLQRGADVNIRDAEGNTPLNMAAAGGLSEAVRVLLIVKPQVDLPNSRGETPLIRAVQVRNMTVARQLLEAGADPDRTDNVAGLSARDYAAQDRRGGPLAKLLADAPKRGKPASVGPKL